ncbi:MAG TPA: acetate/propionate family kinase [Rhodocyclaceae bacterium]
MTQAILTINAGSSSIKFALFALETGEPPAEQAAVVGQVDGIGARGRLVARDPAGKHEQALGLSGDQAEQHAQAMDFVLRWITEHETGWQITAVGHRVVHGGAIHSAPVLLNDEIVGQLGRFNVLAPLHQPHNLNGIRAISRLLPEVPQVACFDTAFHRTMPPVAELFGLPREITAEGVKRYGFHGLSYEYIARSLPKHLGEKARGRVIVAHLGNGASMAALVAGKSVGSTMGFTAIDGLMMGTRTGNIDPGVLLYLMDNKGMDAKALTDLLYKKSGLLGVSGISQDMRTLLASDAPEAAEAVELFCYRIVRELGSLVAAAGGIDALVFTGGIGEHAAEVRRRVCTQLGWLGVTLDEAANGADATRISAAGSAVAVLVIPTNEEWMIAGHTRELLAH